MIPEASDFLAADPQALVSFDHDWTLAELLPKEERPALLGRLAAVVGGPVELVDGPLRPDHDGGHVSAIELDIEPLGWLLGPAANPAALDGLAKLLQRTLFDRQRYLMASALHMESVRADYAALREQHAALVLSEKRLRELTAQLESQVAEQVAIIEVRQRQLYQAERLASIAQLAAGMAHEINNPIGFVRSNLNVAQSYVRQLAEAVSQAREGDDGVWERIDAGFIFADFAELLAESIVGADRIAAIIRDLKGFSNVDREEIAVVDVQASLAELCRLLSPRLPSGAQIECAEGAPQPLRCRPGHVQQALFNVLDNAVRALAPDGVIRVGCVRDKAWLRIEISDDGCGIAAEHLPRVFDPFFTTREVGSGIGLGLTLARDVVLAEGGQIELVSEAVVGTRVTISLPAGEAS